MLHAGGNSPLQKKQVGCGQSFEILNYEKNVEGDCPKQKNDSFLPQIKVIERNREQCT